jgi:uncharacterized protein (TIGR03086 family)
MSYEILQQACASTSAVLGAVRPEQMQDPTPLPGWSVHELVTHIVGCASFFADTAEAGICRSEDREWPDYAAGDFNETFAAESRRLLKAFAAPGAMTKPMTLPSGPATGSLCVLVAAGEIFVHGWDLAKSTGQSTALAPEVAEHLRASEYADLCNTVRANEPAPFADPVPVPEDAPPADRLAGFLGRVP